MLFPTELNHLDIITVWWYSLLEKIRKWKLGIVVIVTQTTMFKIQISYYLEKRVKANWEDLRAEWFRSIRKPNL